ncbi:histidine kinase [Brevibacillus sp. CF112]|nr:histidine kinase [Brevibacillus sp. CF112]
MPFTFELVDIASFLDDFIDELHYDLEEKGIRLQWAERPAASVQVLVDLEKTERTVLNMIENAQKFMDKPEKQILVSVQADPQWATIEIRDNGIGIPEEAIPHLFERFYRAEQSRNSSTGGSGLGLSIARQIIEGHGGDIWVKSKEGVGTSLFFTLRRSNYLGGAKPHDDAHPHH